MSYRRILVTGGAGFVGSHLAIRLARRHPSAEVIAFDNLRRRGSEWNLPRLRRAGVNFIHGDVRNEEDLTAFGEPDLIVECSAEPSVLAGYSSPDFVIQTNLGGLIRCLELARRSRADLVFLSTSRVYPIAGLNAIPWRETETRFEIDGGVDIAGAGPAGIRETFPLEGSRSLYGATKLASEMLISEYRDAFGLRSIVNRCGVIAGPWQMAKPDQGILTFWLAQHYFEKPLQYIGWGGTGKQLRDILHIEDLGDLIEVQLESIDRLSGTTFNVGGGLEGAISLFEATILAREITGKRVVVGSIPENRPGDIRIYVTDNASVTSSTGWRPTRTVRDTMLDLHHWIQSEESTVATLWQ